MKMNLGMNPAMINMMTQTKLYEYYEEYQKFMNISGMPKFEVNPLNDIKHKYSKEASITYKNDCFIFSIFQPIFIFKPDTVKATAFHEFTHILDDITFLQNISYNERKTLLQFYTEYHASQIQIMCACSYSNVNDNHLLSKNEIVYDNNKPQNICEFISFIEKSYFSHIKTKIGNACKSEDVLNSIIHSIYLQGKIDFLLGHCDFDISEYIDVNICNKILGNIFIDLCNTYNNDINNEKEYFTMQNNLFSEVGYYIFENHDKVKSIISDINSSKFNF